MSSVGSLPPDAAPVGRPAAPAQPTDASTPANDVVNPVTAPDTATQEASPNSQAQQPIGGVVPPHPKTAGSDEPPRKNPIIGVDDEQVSYQDEKVLKFRKVPGFRDIGPDFVIDTLLTTGPDSEAFNYANISMLIEALTKHGLYSEVRQGSTNSILIFVKCSTKALIEYHYKDKTRDWLYTVSTVHPSEWNNAEAPKFTPAQRLRLVYSILTAPPSQGGIGITPDLGDWLFVNSIFPLHDYALNKEWIRRWSTKWVIDDEEINWIRNHFGEKHALYFAFLQNYFLWLIIPSVLGIFSHFALGPYSRFYGIASLVWGAVFLQVWQRKESTLAFKWGVANSSSLETPRPQFVPEKTVTDPITGEQKGYYPKWKRALTQLSSIPLAVAAIIVVMILQLISLALEIIIGQLYHGPLKSFFSLLPTGVVVLAIPIAVNMISGIVTKYNIRENHETEDAYEISYTQKLFSLTFITNTGGLFLTAYLYFPFAHLLRPHIVKITEFFASNLSVHFNAPERFDINGGRLRAQFLYLMGTAQVVKFGVSTALPYIIRRVSGEIKNFKEKDVSTLNDDPEEAEFLSEVREQVKLPVHSVQPEYQEMVIQFAQFMLFGIVWPLAPLAALINNWIELRGDAAKICVDTRRPIPSRAESIGPWLLDMKVMTWLASITLSSLLAMFGSTHQKFSHLSNEGMSLVDSTPWTILVYIIVFEHGYLIFYFMVSFLFKSFQNESQIKDKQDRYYLRKISLASEESPVTVTGELKRDTSQPIMNPVESVWQNSSPAVVLEQAKAILRSVKEMNEENKEDKKTK